METNRTRGRVAAVLLALGSMLAPAMAFADRLPTEPGPLGAGEVLSVDIASLDGVADDAAAVSLNVTITEATAAGHATVFPCGEAVPNASSLNFEPGGTVANGLVSKLGQDGRVCVTVSVDAHVIVDLDGYFPAGSHFRPISPARLLDSRPQHPTVDGRFAGDGMRSAGGVLVLDVAGRGGVHSDARAITLNLTATEPTRAGYATVFPCDHRQPDASSLNFSAGQTIANSITTRLAADGSVCIFTDSATHLVADVTGWFDAGTNLRSLQPARLLDSRLGHRTIDGRSAGLGMRVAGDVLRLDITGRGGVASDATAIALNLTITGPRAGGFATVWPCGSTQPDSSTINFDRGATIANSILVKVGSQGRVCIVTSADTHVIADVTGYFARGGGFHPMTPARVHDTRPVDPAPTATTTTSIPTNPADALSFELLNQLRAAHGAGPVVLDPTMTAEAIAWSEEMPRTGFRHSELGYAENVAYHSWSPMTPTKAAEVFHDMWVDSPGHFRNMINPRWTKVGVGLHRSDRGWFATHVFID